ncbi:MAG TPA: FeoA family protein [Blastocatellia bacterium]|nr:FeoA family protein [Blastocatellia bacterium]
MLVPQIEIDFHFTVWRFIATRGVSMSLVDAPQNEWHQIDSVNGPEDERRRLLDLGLTPGEELAVIQSVPFGDPLVVLVRGMRLALRRREAAWIRVR